MVKVENLRVNFSQIAKHGTTGQNYLTQLDLKNTWPELDFFLPEAKTGWLRTRPMLPDLTQTRTIFKIFFG